MAALLNSNRLLLCLLAAVCYSPRSALIYLLLTSVLLALTKLFAALLRRVSLPCPTEVLLLLAAGFGGVLCMILTATIPDLALSPSHPLTAALLLTCGLAAADEQMPPLRILPAMLLIGVIRECLAEGTLWGLHLLPMGVAPALGNGPGGLLLAALVLWAFGLARPTPAVFLSPGPVLTTAWFTAAGSAVGLFCTSLTGPYILWLAALITVPAMFLPSRQHPGTCLLLPALAVVITGSLSVRPTPLLPLILGLAVLLLLPAFAALKARTRRCLSFPQRFAGAPAALTLAAIGWCVATSF